MDNKTQELGSNIITTKQIEERIFTIRNKQVIVDRDLAELYQVETKILNQAVKRNIDRFPESFRFQVSDSEKSELVTICDRLKILKHSGRNPYAFTEQGVAMISSVLRSDIAIKISIQIIQAFVEMRGFISSNAGIFQRLDNVEKKLIHADEKFEKLFNSLKNNYNNKEKGILFDGQVFEAYVFTSEIIRSAKTSLIVIDNYIDDTVLTLLSKRQNNVSITIYTKSISRQLRLDLEKHNEQYPKIDIRVLKESHDRFILIDNTELYHFGASLKDLGKKWFAFCKMDIEANALLRRLTKYR